MLKMIQKRNKSLVPFEKEKIESAVYKALLMTKLDWDKTSLSHLCLVVVDKVVRALNEKYNKQELPSVEDIQDLVEIALMSLGEYETAKAYIKYRHQHSNHRVSKKTNLGIMSLIEDYVGQEDVHKEQTYSLDGLNNHILRSVSQHFWLYRVYSDTVRSAHEKGDIHLHELCKLSCHSSGWSLVDLLTKGMGGDGHINAHPAKHFETALMQVLNFILSIQKEMAHAQTISHFDTYLAPFIHHDGLNYNQVRQLMQVFIFNLNLSKGMESCQKHISLVFDKEVPEGLKQKPIIIGGQYHYDLTYGDFQKEMDMINLSFCEVMMSGDASGRLFALPSPVYNVTRDWHWDNMVTNTLVDMSKKIEGVSFANYINNHLEKHMSRLSECPLAYDQDYLYHRGLGATGSHPDTGAIGEISINMARIGYLAQDVDDLLQRLERIMDICKEALETKRQVVEANMIKGLYPHSKYYLEDVYDQHGDYLYHYYGAISIQGLNECIENLTQQRENIATDMGKVLAEEIMDHMNELLVAYQQTTGHLYTLKSGSKKKVANRFHHLDQSYYEEGDISPYRYTNGSYLPDQASQDLHDSLDHQESIQAKYTGGSMFYSGIAAEDLSLEGMKKSLKSMLTNYDLPYLSFAHEREV